jgi:beta-lactamase regulating signal transducer with metallopeptidase domain
MNGFLMHAFAFSTAATAALASAIWEGALLAALVFAVLRMFPRLSAAARSVIWLNVFILVALLHVLPAITANRIAVHAGAAHALRIDPRWSLAVAAVWIALSLARVGQLIFGAIHLRRIARSAKSVPVSEALEPLLRHKGHSVQLCASRDVARPSVLGFFRPRILVPPALLQELSETELRQVILHEMEHLRRGDDWINLLQKLALVLFPLNPALAWVERRICAERELACDDRVLHAGSGRKAYALCLTHLAEYALVKRSFSLVLGAWERRPELVRRVHRILAGPARSMGRRPALVAMGSVTAGALACTLVLAHAPQVVRFSPAVHISGQNQAANASFNAQELGRELGGKPQLVKAVMDEPAHTAQPVRQTSAHKAGERNAAVRNTSARSAAVRRHKTPPAALLAKLRVPPPDSGTMLVMTTAWTETDSRTQVIVTFAQTHLQPRMTQLRADSPHPAMSHATYAVVPTPTGWLVIQI